MRRIVLAEDDETMVHLLSTLLRMDGFEVQTVGREEEVAAVVRRTEPDALLLDMHLAGQSGLEVLDALRQSELAAHLRIIMISGLNVREDCLRRGADDFLLKPFMPDELLQMLHKSLDAP
jgi:two-component system phosphate regulon response regulator PhoB